MATAMANLRTFQGYEDGYADRVSDEDGYIEGHRFR